MAGSGEKLHNVHVQLIFWGAWWNDNPLAQSVNDALANLLAGPYMTYLAQYDVRRGDIRGVTFAGDSEPGTFDMSDVKAFILGLIDDDRLPEPDEQWPIVYAVIVPPPPNATSKDPGLSGANSKTTWVDRDIGDDDDDPVYCLWAGNDGTLDFVTTVLSHELVEIATDPNEGDGVRQVGCMGGECQIADVPVVCHNWCDRVRGVNAQAYWSQLDGNGALPSMYSVRRTLFGKSIGGKLPRPLPSANAWIASQF
jgi:hypothetical protein